MDLSDATQVIPPAGSLAEQFMPPVRDPGAFLPAAVPPLLPDPDDEPPAVFTSWEDRYRYLLDQAYAFGAEAEIDPSQVIAWTRAAGEIRAGLAAGLLPRWQA